MAGSSPEARRVAVREPGAPRAAVGGAAKELRVVHQVLLASLEELSGAVRTHLFEVEGALIEGRELGPGERRRLLDLAAVLRSCTRRLARAERQVGSVARPERRRRSAPK